MEIKPIISSQKLIIFGSFITYGISKELPRIMQGSGII